MGFATEIFVDPPQIHVKCLVCLEVLESPVSVCDEGHVYCLSCVTPLRKCPQCRQNITCKHKCRRLQDEIGQLLVTCAATFGNSRCEWSGPLLTHSEHVSTCTIHLRSENARLQHELQGECAAHQRSKDRVRALTSFVVNVPRASRGNEGDEGEDDESDEENVFVLQVEEHRPGHGASQHQVSMNLSDTYGVARQRLMSQLAGPSQLIIDGSSEFGFFVSKFAVPYPGAGSDVTMSDFYAAMLRTDNPAAPSLKTVYAFPAGGIQVFLKTLTGAIKTYDIAADELVDIFKMKVFARDGIPADQSRIIFGGRQLEDGHTLSSYGISKESTLVLLLRLRNIGAWIGHGGHASSFMPTNQLAGVTDGARAQIIAQAIGPAVDSHQCGMFEQVQGLLSSGACAMLCTYVDRFASKLNSNDLYDLRLEVSPAELTALLGTDGMASIMARCSPWQNSHRSGDLARIPRLVLRRTVPVSGEGKQCIAFHRDHAIVTLNVALNADTEYSGGQLIIVSSDCIALPLRPAGHAVIMGTATVHGVTALQAGVRYALVAFHELPGNEGPDHGFPFVTEMFGEK